MFDVKQKIKNFISEHKSTISDNDQQFLNRTLKVENPFSYFYITAKVHKTPWKARPIVSQCGSTLDGLARWLTQQLKPLSQKMPSYLSSSKKLKTDLEELSLDPNTRYQIFTADARAMYTNISTTHALDYISWFLRTSPMCKDMPIEAIIDGLTLLMEHNVFKFGNT